MGNKIINGIEIMKYLRNWPIFFLDRLHLIRQNIVIYRFRNGVKLITRTGTCDRGLINAIWIEENYTRFPGFSVKDDDIIVDIGAHIGVFSIFAAVRAKNGRIYSYEPFLENFRLLEKNISMNSLSNINIFNLGVCGKERERNLFVEKDTGGHNLYNNLNLGSREIRCTTIEGIFNSNNLDQINFLKIDCEGAEYEILFNTPKDVFKKIDKISLEYHSSSSNLNTELKNFLRNMNFDIILIDKPTEHILYGKNKQF